MKLAIICPVGDLTRFGYWRIAPHCLESWQQLGELYLVHSSRIALPFHIAAHYIRDPHTLMLPSHDGEVFSHRLVAANTNLGLALARQAGCDCAITICVNWYVEEVAAEAIRAKCQRMLDQERGYEFLYRRWQFGAHLLEADLRSICVFSLQDTQSNVVEVLVDRAVCNGAMVTSDRGEFSTSNAEAYVDCGLEVKTSEFRDKMADVRNYEDILPKRHGVSWPFWERYYRERASKMRVSVDVPQVFGQRIIAARPAATFSDWVLRAMGVSNES